VFAHRDVFAVIERGRRHSDRLDRASNHRGSRASILTFEGAAIGADRSPYPWQYLNVTDDRPTDLATQVRLTREAYDRLAPVWSSTIDDGPWNGHLERPALRSLLPPALSGATVLDAGCGADGQAE